MVAHEAYRRLSLAELRQAVRTPVLVDGRRVFSVEEAQRTGFIYRGIGIGTGEQGNGGGTYACYSS